MIWTVSTHSRPRGRTPRAAFNSESTITSAPVEVSTFLGVAGHEHVSGKRDNVVDARPSRSTPSLTVRHAPSSRVCPPTAALNDSMLVCKMKAKGHRRQSRLIHPPAWDSGLATSTAEPVPTTCSIILSSIGGTIQLLARYGFRVRGSGFESIVQSRLMGRMRCDAIMLQMSMTAAGGKLPMPMPKILQRGRPRHDARLVPSFPSSLKAQTLCTVVLCSE
ncbi:hypothetical protein L226DRAFT_297521 [Lentinus tigrinus ALCF2SS1-7]|uniref:uncharacterized protein n=1 Tax=Lentinus tigrinus ALCF2SS1-7 TaxID=1328758 RepID=UPI0011662D48|nr:hypothetical protein L226DRAFT_297521 [Lentinus tigrinus ALCF2SS1-7]